MPHAPVGAVDHDLFLAVCDLVAAAKGRIAPRATQSFPTLALVGDGLADADTPSQAAREGRFVDAVRLGRDAINALGNPLLVPRLWVRSATSLAEALIEVGHWSEAESYLAQARFLCATGPDAVQLDLAAGLVSCRAGYLASAKELLGRVDLALEHGGPAAALVGRAVLAAEIALAGADLTTARLELTTVLDTPDLFAETSLFQVILLAARVEADAATAQPAPRRRPDHVLDSSARMDQILRIGAAIRPADILGVAFSAQLAAEHARFDGRDSADCWRSAVDALDVTGQVYDRAWALVNLATCLLASGDKSAASDILAEVNAIGSRLGAVRLVEAASTVVRRGRIGLRPADSRAGRGGHPGRHGLTERELEVLRLVTEGCSNAEIARELFISPKTASVHVSRILTKLGVASRSQATTTAHRLRLFADSSSL